jgi:signal peptidase I
MADTQIIDATEPAIRAPRSEMRDFGSFMIKLVIAMFLLRSLIFAPFNIPSESMMPRLLVGDFLIVTKWPYGFSKHSFPFNLPLTPGRVFSTLPARGDVVVFKTPQDNRTDFIKRVIGLPGDTVQMIHGQLFLNGQPVPKQRLDDWVGTPTPGQSCLTESEKLCHFPRYRETLPEGRSYDVLDLRDQSSDTTSVYTVPKGQLFLMGDNRDNSEDSRFTLAENGIGLVPMENLVGRAQFMFFSWDANGDWAHKIRWSRIGSGF